MFRGYNLEANSLNKKFFAKFEEAGRDLFENNKTAISLGLETYKNGSGDLLASKITEEWFPDVHADVFLSHSHKDEALVIQLAGWLKQEFGLDSFIDSCLWGYSDELLRLIDNNHCYKSETKTYNYQERNRSTSHVHMMLSTALTKMIHECECIFFISTPQSISTENYIKGKGMTSSPWIYSEILTTKLIEKRQPDQHRRRIALEEAFNKALGKEITASVKVNYDLDVKHLISIGPAELDAWRSAKPKRGSKALDTLYALKQE